MRQKPRICLRIQTVFLVSRGGAGASVGGALE